MKSQLDNAIADGRSRGWFLVGIGQWQIYPLSIQEKPPQHPMPVHTQGGLTMDHLSVLLLHFKHLPQREYISTQTGIEEMRQTWIPFVFGQLQKIIRNTDALH